MISETKGKIPIKNLKSKVKFQIMGYFWSNLSVLSSLERQRSTKNR